MRTLFSIGMLIIAASISSTQALAQVAIETPANFDDLVVVQQMLDEQKATFTVGRSEISAMELQDLAATVVPQNLMASIQNQLLLSQRLEAAKVGAIQANADLRDRKFTDDRAKCDPSSKEFDWNALGYVSDIQAQGACGSCWAFAAVGALEASHSILNGKKHTPISEQFVLDCAAANGCEGNWFGNAFTVLMAGAPSKASLPYRGVAGICLPSKPITRAVNWSYLGNFGVTPSDKALKQALCDHGPIVVAVKATPLFKYYSEGVFNEYAQGQHTADVNHAVLLTGWDDEKRAWTIKNSWGPMWGEKGFMRIAYRSNNIGFGAAWVEATLDATAPVVDPALDKVLENVISSNQTIFNEVPASAAGPSIGWQPIADQKLPLQIPLDIYEMLKIRDSSSIDG